MSEVSPLKATLAPVNVTIPDMPVKVTEDDMLRVLWRHYIGAGWFPIPQVSTEDEDTVELTESRVLAIRSLRRIDMMMVRKPRKEGIGPIETMAIEVKVTREDWKRDLDNPGKQQAWRSVAHRHAYAVPAGLVHRDEVPEGSGLIVVKFSGSHGYGFPDWAKRAPYLGDDHHLLPSTIRTMFARLATLEGKTRGWNVSEQLSGNVEDLRASLLSLQKAAEKAQRDKDRAEAQRDAWRELHARTNPKGAPCQWCGQPVKGLRPTKDGWFKGWRHVNPADDEACAELEADAADDTARALYEAANEAERRSARRMAEWRFANMGKGHPDPDKLDAEPWLSFLGQVQVRGPWPADEAPEAE